MNNHRVCKVLMPHSKVMENCVTGKLQLNVIYSVWTAKFLWFDFVWCDGCAFGDLFIRNCNSTVKLAKTLNHKLKIAIGAKSSWELTQADFVTILLSHIQCTLHSAQGTTHQLWYSCIRKRKKSTCNKPSDNQYVQRSDANVKYHQNQKVVTLSNQLAINNAWNLIFTMLAQMTNCSSTAIAV